MIVRKVIFMCLTCMCSGRAGDRIMLTMHCATGFHPSPNTVVVFKSSKLHLLSTHVCVCLR